MVRDPFSVPTDAIDLARDARDVARKWYVPREGRRPNSERDASSFPPRVSRGSPRHANLRPFGGDMLDGRQKPPRRGRETRGPPPARAGVTPPPRRFPAPPDHRRRRAANIPRPASDTEATLIAPLARRTLPADQRLLIDAARSVID